MITQAISAKAEGLSGSVIPISEITVWLRLASQRQAFKIYAISSFVSFTPLFYHSSK
jgi:hypothetical protein